MRFFKWFLGLFLQSGAKKISAKEGKGNRDRMKELVARSEDRRKKKQ